MPIARCTPIAADVAGSVLPVAQYATDAVAKRGDQGIVLFDIVEKVESYHPEPRKVR